MGRLLKHPRSPGGSFYLSDEAGIADRKRRRLRNQSVIGAGDAPKPTLAGDPTHDAQKSQCREALPASSICTPKLVAAKVRGPALHGGRTINGEASTAIGPAFDVAPTHRDRRIARAPPKVSMRVAIWAAPIPIGRGPDDRHHTRPMRQGTVLEAGRTTTWPPQVDAAPRVSWIGSCADQGVSRQPTLRSGQAMPPFAPPSSMSGR